jgi:hypothetical protein
MYTYSRLNARLTVFSRSKSPLEIGLTNRKNIHFEKILQKKTKNKLK